MYNAAMSDPQSSPPTPSRNIAWGLVAGVTGSLCCLGPAAAVLLGLGASSALASLQLGRVLVAALSVGLLAVGVALAMRRSAACGLSPTRRLRAPLLMLAVFGVSYVLLAYAVPAVAARRLSSAPVAASAPAAPLATGLAAAAPRRLTLSIEKMYCPPCAAIVRRHLAEHPGVLAVVAELGVDQVTVDYRPADVAAETLASLFPGSYGVAVLSDAALP